jgi:uncharacterized protein
MQDNIKENLEIDLFLEGIAEELPIIRPISEFIHLNLLLPYQNLPFWEAIKTVSKKFEAMPFGELELYREKIKSGFLSEELIKQKLNQIAPSQIEEIIDLLHHKQVEFIHHDLRNGKLHHHWNTSLGVNIASLADSMLIKWMGMYIDQGIGLWEMPGADDYSFYETIKNLFQESLVKPAPFSSKNFEFLFADSAEDAISRHLKFLCPDPMIQAEYLRESIFTLRGWAGLIYCLEKNPSLIPFKRKVRLIDFMAVKLILERAWIINHNPNVEAPNFKEIQSEDFNPIKDEKIFNLFRACQEALEEETYKHYFQKLNLTQRKEVKNPSYQAIFCMDDRECALRRNLENLNQGIETFGTAGHFGIEGVFQHSEDAFPKKQCPAPLTPRYLIQDVVFKKGKKEELTHDLIQPSHKFLGDFFQSIFGGFKSGIFLAMNLFFPLAFKKTENVRETKLNSRLDFIHRGESPDINGLKIGYTHEEIAELLNGQLRLIGFVHQFAPLIFVFGHGSNSVNNPYFATYGCGACSGRPGSANARTFAAMANLPEVREILKEKYHINIPASTYFVAGFHDTCRDLIDFYDTHLMPDHLKDSFQKFKKYLSLAVYKNARERSQMFKLVTYRPVSKLAQKEVLRRSYSLFETRPEMGHTNVAFSIVGNRSLTKEVDLNRRSFLQSYDREIDPEGEILASSLGAVIPVTSGINLDYFFSRVDNLRFGAGSKLPQNIVGNIGVSHGTESDLLFGLPFQMIDQHTPLRLFVLVEQSPEIALSAIQRNPLVKEIVYNSWVHYGCWDYKTQSYYVFRKGEMIKLNQSLDQLC